MISNQFHQDHHNQYHHQNIKDLQEYKIPKKFIQNLIAWQEYWRQIISL